MTQTETLLRKIGGGAFLAEDSEPSEVFAPEDLSEEHRAIAKTAAEFFTNEVTPNLEALLRQEPGVGPRLLRKSAELGLTAIGILEEFGGLEMDLPSSIVVAEQLARNASYSAWHGAHASIGTLPLLFYGTQRQKTKYLAKLASAELIAAYALTEPQAGSDALAIRTRAELSADGSHYVLNGQKAWITNGGQADLYTVFARAGGKDFTAFLVERAFPGVSSGAEEKKMGLKGSSTTALYFDNVKVPVENVLGEIGRGHVIAFNILNFGRLKLGASSTAMARNALVISLQYAQRRKAFNSTLADFGAIRHKLAEMAVRAYAAESATWRVTGLMNKELSDEYAVECSIVKVFASEALAYAADEGVQIHGGYGFHQDYEVEHIYRDARINRIFEGTNEINRLLISGTLLKRAAKKQISLSRSQPPAVSRDDEEARLVSKAKEVALLALAITQENQRQEIMMYAADIVIDTFVMESVLLRTRKLFGRSAMASAICSVFLRDAMARIELSARNIVGATRITQLRELCAYDPINSVELRNQIAEGLLAKGKLSI